MVVGSGGTIQKLQNGTFGELFPDSSEISSQNSVLALDVISSSGVRRLLVSGTENLDAERVSALHFEKGAELTYLLWEGVVNSVHPFLNLASFDGDQWSEVIPIAGSVYAEKGIADLVIIPENSVAQKTASIPGVPTNRTVIYVSWKEISPVGGDNFVVPIILEDGEYIGWRQVFNLSDFLDTAPGNRHELPPSLGLDSNYQNMLAIQPSAKGSTVVIGFINDETGRFITLELEMLPLALSVLRQRLTDILIEYSETSTSVPELIEQTQTALMREGGDFHLSVLEYLANRLAELLSEHSTVAAAVAPANLEKIGAAYLDIGARVRRKGLIDLEPLGIFSLGRESHGREAFHHYLKVSLVVERDAPAVEGPATIMLSRTGENALVVWSDENAVYYRETQGELWEEATTVELKDGLDQETVYKILSERTLNR